MTQDILPPSRGHLATRTSLPARHDRPLPPGAHVPSGHWWAFLDGAGDHRSMVNGQTLIYPRGVWFVVENKHFVVLKNSLEPMMWLDGFDLWEKTIDGFNNVGERKVRTTPQTYPDVPAPSIAAALGLVGHGDGG